jgi:hypothetical protein
MSKLDQLLASIRPEVTLDETSRRADEALNSFELGTAMIHHWQEFTVRIGKFFAHVEARMLRMGGPVHLDPSFHWSRCAQMLRNIYGPSGEKIAFEKARTGNEGGLYTVLKALALTMGEQCAENEIRARIGQYWGQLTVNEQLAAVDEYLQKYGHLLPSETTEGSAGRIRAGFPKVLEMHASLLHGIRRVGR